MIKKESASRLRKIGLFYTNVPSETVKSIHDAIALGLWIYLQSQSDDFVVRAAHLQNHFNLSRERYRLAMRYLRDFRLIRDRIEQDEKGRIRDRYIECHALPFEVAEDSSICTENRIDGKTQQTEESVIRKFHPLIKNKETSLIKEQERIKNQPFSPSFDKDSQALKTLCSRLKLKGISGASPLNAELISLLNDGIGVDHVMDVATEAVERDRKSLGWITATIIGRREDARKLAEKPKATSKPSKPTPTHASRVETPSEPLKKAKAPSSVLAMLDEQRKKLAVPRNDLTANAGMQEAIDRPASSTKPQSSPGVEP